MSSKCHFCKRAPVPGRSLCAYHLEKHRAYRAAVRNGEHKPRNLSQAKAKALVSKTKVCIRCGKRKVKTGFAPHKGTIDGFETTCKACKVESVNQWRKNNPEKFKIRKAIDERRRYLRAPEKFHTRNTTRAMVRRGDLQRPDRCSRCRKPGPVEAHHPDYANAQDVRWLCRRCHRRTHVE